jgi:biopolymer transport protein ExbB
MLEQIMNGGPIMLALVGLSVITVAVIIDRYRVFKVAYQVSPNELFGQIRNALDQEDVDKGIDACKKAKGPVAAVLYVGLHKFKVLRDMVRPRDDIRQNVDRTLSEYAPHVIEALEKHVNYLLIIGSVSPLLGMTGTVTGMISSFEGMQSEGVSGGAVAGGISEALLTTAGGLIVAIPAVVFYSIFTKKIDNLTLQIEEKASDMVEYLDLYILGEGDEYEVVYEEDE